MKFKILILLYLWGLNALSFNKHNHTLISRLSLKYYSTRFNVTVSSREMEAFITGSEYEDYSKRLISKSRNQHFHRIEVQLEKKRHLMRRLSVLYKELRHFKAKNNKYMFWKTLGKITHYFQDMACPPHVIPIYHLAEDSFDNIRIDTAVINYPEVTIANLNQSIAKDSLQLINHFNGLTFQSINEPLEIYINSIKEIKNWQVFWTRDKTFVKAKHFGTYGIAGNNFGKSDVEFKCKNNKSNHHIFGFKRDTHFCCEDTTKTFKVESVQTETFKYKRVKQAIEATLVMIHYGINYK